MIKNKIFKSLIVAELAASMIFSTFSVAFADEAAAVGSQFCTLGMSYEDKINDMYSHIDNETIRNMYIDQTEYYITSSPSKKKCTIQKTADIYDAPHFTPNTITIHENDIDMYDYYDFERTSEFINRNKEGIDVLYDLCQIAKNDTIDMTEEQKMGYLMSFVSSYMTYNHDYSNAILNDKPVPTFFEKLPTKSGVCSDFAQLFAILGQYIDIDANIVTGLYDGYPHAWNTVTINGTRYSIEPIYGMFTENINSVYKYQEKVKTDDYETNLRLLWQID